MVKPQDFFKDWQTRTLKKEVECIEATDRLLTVKYKDGTEKSFKAIQYVFDKEKAEGYYVYEE